MCDHQTNQTSSVNISISKNVAQKYLFDLLEHNC